MRQRAASGWNCGDGRELVGECQGGKVGGIRFLLSDSLADDGWAHELAFPWSRNSRYFYEALF